MLNPKCLCKLAKTKVDLLICTNLCRVLKNKTQHKHNRARAAVQRTIFLLKFALFSKPFLKKVCASDDCNSGLDAVVKHKSVADKLPCLMNIFFHLNWLLRQD